MRVEEVDYIHTVLALADLLAVLSESVNKTLQNSILFLVPNRGRKEEERGEGRKRGRGARKKGLGERGWEEG